MVHWIFQWLLAIRQSVLLISFQSRDSHLAYVSFWLPVNDSFVNVDEGQAH